MKILILCKFFYPQLTPRSFRATELAKEFSRQGNDVRVCFPTIDYDYTLFEKENKLVIETLGKLKFKNIEIKGNKVEKFIKRFFRRVLQLIFEYPDIELFFKISNMLKKVNGYDLLISIAVPHTIHWGVAKAWNKNKPIAKMWIADCGDPYMGSKTDTFRKLFYFRFMEKWFCNKADYITVPYEGAKEAYYPEFNDKIRVIPQGFNLDKIKINPYVRKYDYPVFAYAGEFIPGKRDPSKLLNYLSLIKKYYRFIIYTNKPNYLFPFKEKLGKRLEIRNYVPREKLLPALAEMDFLVNFDNNTTSQLPSKLIDYAITRRPVVNIAADTNFDIIDEFINGNYKKKLRLDDPEKYDIKLIASQFISLIEDPRVNSQIIQFS